MLAVVCGVIALTTTLLLKQDLDSAASNKLASAFSQSMGFVDQQSHGGRPPLARDPGGDGAGAPGADGGGAPSKVYFVGGLPDGSIGAVIDNGTITAATTPDTLNASDPRVHQPKALDPAKVTALAAVPTGTDRKVALPGLGDYLVRSQLTAGGQTLVVGVPLHYGESLVSELIAAEAVVTVAGLIAAGFVTFALIRISLKPLDRVAATAGRLSRQPLHRGEVGELVRVPEADTDPRTEAGQVGASLNRLIEHVSDALAARHASETRVRQFVADASHELRTPLASIAGYAELTRRGRETVPPDTAYALSRVESEAARMTRLVEDLLLLARLDAGRPLERAPLDLSPLVVDAVRDAHAANPGHRWQLDLPDDPVTVDGDPHRLHQVLVNLLANSGKHTPPGTVVTASVVPAGDCCELRITDDGPGIPEALLPTVFERFARGDGSRSRAAGSTGLGLAIVAAVTASHGGRVSVQSEPGRTVFAVRLPLSSAQVGAVVQAALN
ncbi:sensor histidine kinase [Streptacidiphilus cavernicola]